MKKRYQIPAPDGRVITKKMGFTGSNGNQYARGWLETSTEAERTALGITEVEPEPTPPTPPYQPTGEDVQAEAARRLQAIGAAYSREERETWATQVDEAKALALDPAAAAPFLTARAAGRGVTAAQLATLVLTKADAFAQASGAILAAQDALAAIDPIPQNITDDSHWPA